MAARKSNVAPSETAVPALTDLGKCSEVHVQNTVTKYTAHYEDEHESKIRISKAKEVAETYYSIATDFYEYGWGQSFHFAPVYGDPTLYDCLSEYERGVAVSLNARPGMKILDLGCGIGGPLRQVARFSGAHVTGINCSEYQVKRAKIITRMEDEHLQSLCDYVVGDFCDMSCFEDNSFDGAFGMEAICHARDFEPVYKEIFRVLKPGALLVESSWVLTENYDPNNPEHVKQIDGICSGGGLPTMRTKGEVLQAIKTAGFEIKEVNDLRKEGDQPWTVFLTGKSCMSLQSFRASTFGRAVTHGFLTVLECAHLAPRGVTKVHSVICVCADNLIAAAKTDIFTPSFRLIVQKPE